MKGFLASTLAALAVTQSHANLSLAAANSNFLASKAAPSCVVSTVEELLAAVKNVDCAQIGVKSGHYALTGHIEAGSSLGLLHDVSITALDGAGTVVIDAAGQSGVLGAYNRSTVHLKGIDMIGGSLSANNAAGFFVSGGSSATLEDCNIYQNSAGEFGGGVAVWLSGSLTMIRCSVHDNVAGWRGGGVFCAGNLVLDKTEITHNKAPLDSEVSKFNGCHVTNKADPIFM